MTEGDPAGVEGELEGDSTGAAVAAGEDGAIVRQHAGGLPVDDGSSLEAAIDVGGLEHVSGDAGDAEPRVVIDNVEHLDVSAVAQAPMGDVGLPPLVWLGRLEPHIGALGPLVGLRDDEASFAQDPPDGGDRGTVAVAALEMEGDGGGAGLVTGLGQVLADLDDLVFNPGRRSVRAAARPAGPGNQPSGALALVALHQGDDPAARHPVVPGHLALCSEV